MTDKLTAKFIDDLMRPTWTLILPTYRRPDVLAQCLDHLQQSSLDPTRSEILILDNGLPASSRSVADRYRDRLSLQYIENEPGHGFGYSVCRGAELATGDLILELNDDALIPADFFERIEAVFASDPTIGVVGVRVIEAGYEGNGNEIGIIDASTLQVVGNFHLQRDHVIDVEHVYGFCYAYRRELLERGGHHDRTLLAQDYSSGNRIETDHCLTARKLGYRVVFDGRMAVEHLAKPRGDMSERSLKWKLNHTRNTLYLYLKHFGLFRRRGLALRFALLHDLGLRSALLRPTFSNWAWFLNGVRARSSAVAHWLAYLVSSPPVKTGPSAIAPPPAPSSTSNATDGTLILSAQTDQQTLTQRTVN